MQMLQEMLNQLLHVASVSFSDITLDLLEKNKSNSSMIETNPSPLCTNSAESPNSSNELVEGCDSMTFSTQFRELVSLLEDFQNIDYKALK